MSSPQRTLHVHDATKPDWPFHQGQICQTSSGAYYNVLWCDWDYLMGTWWIRVRRQETMGWLQAKYLHTCMIPADEMRRLTKLVSICSQDKEIIKTTNGGDNVA
jgi:hypothetical protein